MRSGRNCGSPATRTRQVPASGDGTCNAVIQPTPISKAPLIPWRNGVPDGEVASIEGRPGWCQVRPSKSSCEMSSTSTSNSASLMRRSAPSPLPSAVRRGRLNCSHSSLEAGHASGRNGRMPLLLTTFIEFVISAAEVSAAYDGVVLIVLTVLPKGSASATRSVSVALSRSEPIPCALSAMPLPASSTAKSMPCSNS
ncbi:hypothetical protein D3C72_1271410 [compost metagenome]